jgi:hypothetical protein
MLVFRVAAEVQGLRIRTGLRGRTLPWDGVTGAEARVGELWINGPSGAVTGYTGFLRPRRVAGEISVVIGDPALRPTAE